MDVIGVDWAKDGWLAIRITSFTAGGWDIRVFPTVAALFDEWGAASLILIDIPIGLPNSERRTRSADRLARRMLGKRGSSVFPAPGRAAIEAFRQGGYQNYQAGSDTNRRELGKGLSKQAWGIVPKVGEVDVLLRSSDAARKKIREVHPELCFWGFNGERAMSHSKKKDEGIRERLAVLCNIEPMAESIWRDALSMGHRGVNENDILDALAAAFTAVPEHAALSDIETIPSDAEHDVAGLPMEMLYRFPRGFQRTLHTRHQLGSL